MHHWLLLTRQGIVLLLESPNFFSNLGCDGPRSYKLLISFILKDWSLLQSINLLTPLTYYAGTWWGHWGIKVLLHGWIWCDQVICNKTSTEKFRVNHVLFPNFQHFQKDVLNLRFLKSEMFGKISFLTTYNLPQK